MQRISLQVHASLNNKRKKERKYCMSDAPRSKRTQSTTVWCVRAKHVILTPHRCMLPLSSLCFLWPSPFTSTPLSLSPTPHFPSLCLFSLHQSISLYLSSPFTSLFLSHIHTDTHKHTDTHTHTYRHTHIQTQTQTQTHTHTHTHTQHTHTHTHTHTSSTYIWQ